MTADVSFWREAVDSRVHSLSFGRDAYIAVPSLAVLRKIILNTSFNLGEDALLDVPSMRIRNSLTKADVVSLHLSLLLPIQKVGHPILLDDRIVIVLLLLLVFILL